MSDDQAIGSQQGTPDGQSGDAVLIWEDGDSGPHQWWLSRAHLGERQFFIARDDLTSVLVGVERNPNRQDYRVITVVPYIAPGSVKTLADVKSAVLGSVVGSAPSRRGPIIAWWLRRAALLALRQLPLAVSAFLIGGVLALAVAMFAVSSGLTGWPMAIVGVVIGAAAGPVFKTLAVKGLAPDLGAWGRMVLATLFAALGAAIGAGGWMALFWS